MDVGTAIRHSRSYRLFQRSSEILSNSLVYRAFRSGRVLAALLFVFVTASIVRILTSNMSDPVAFLSFAVMFLVLAWLLRDVVRPSES